VGSHGRRFRPNSALLMDAVTARRSPWARCPYTSLAIVMLACPKISNTACSVFRGRASARRLSAAVRAGASGQARLDCTAWRRRARSSPGREVPRSRWRRSVRDLGCFTALIAATATGQLTHHGPLLIPPHRNGIILPVSCRGITHLPGRVQIVLGLKGFRLIDHYPRTMLIT
jgi:hypothetical protein